jgi:hypothetical protein
MSNFTIFIVGLVITLITGMGVITSQVFVGYDKLKLPDLKEYDPLIGIKN